MLQPLSPIPNERTMTSYLLKAVGDGPSKQHIAVCYYPDCIREFDGKNWKVVQDLRKQAPRYIGASGTEYL